MSSCIKIKIYYIIPQSNHPPSPRRGYVSVSYQSIASATRTKHQCLHSRGRAELNIPAARSTCLHDYVTWKRWQYGGTVHSNHPFSTIPRLLRCSESDLRSRQQIRRQSVSQLKAEREKCHKHSQARSPKYKTTNSLAPASLYQSSGVV